MSAWIRLLQTGGFKDAFRPVWSLAHLNCSKLAMTPLQQFFQIIPHVGAFVAFVILTSTAFAQAARDPEIEALISRMTIEEKAGQLTIISDASRTIADGVNPEFNRRRVDALEAEIRAGRVGALLSGNGAAAARDTQRIAMRGTRMKIPILFGADVIHGHRTVFPIPLGEAASFEPDLAYRTARVQPTNQQASLH